MSDVLPSVYCPVAVNCSLMVFGKCESFSVTVMLTRAAEQLTLTLVTFDPPIVPLSFVTKQVCPTG